MNRRVFGNNFSGYFYNAYKKFFDNFDAIAFTIYLKNYFRQTFRREDGNLKPETLHPGTDYVDQYREINIS